VTQTQLVLDRGNSIIGRRVLSPRRDGQHTPPAQTTMPKIDKASRRSPNRMKTNNAVTTGTNRIDWRSLSPQSGGSASTSARSPRS
jgi:hypothetical protein